MGPFQVHKLILTIVQITSLVVALINSTSLADEFTTSASAGSPFIWQPLPLRATFRPLNRQAANGGGGGGGELARSFRPPRPPRQPASGISERSISSDTSGGNENVFSGNRFVSAAADSPSSPFSSSFFQPPPPFEFSTTTTSAPTITTISIVTTTTTSRPNAFGESNSFEELNDERPTRQPMNRFRPTRAPSDDEDASAGDYSLATGGAGERGATSANSSRMSSECFECICEASTNCNQQSRCQTSDVRHTRCGMFLISYDQWLATGLSRSLVSREALARDAAADERAFYECVTQRDCAERLLAIYLARNSKDCDRDGRVDCYDLAAIHHSGLEQCASESLLDSQYWSDFNACLGFGR